ncbi:hypothetical protein E3P92_04158 [Wallemia ichthyophaga]|nr:hypothetical protein E3P98_04149 [Wallemia ichthyophaga]TIA94630.1 hypothetical protein E3P95_04153 [Wallemia ichthyophaga]TIA94989.1 hypothetical protein E3P94_04154 [Wallemia ichthyophaga]TIB07017.1 hypothetical protein E3P92_04158 [Wallemia ichthyophaga]TIB60077.1 hypothetical protein E3P77_04150 [Wallemia ichthyophaga]
MSSINEQITHVRQHLRELELKLQREDKSPNNDVNGLSLDEYKRYGRHMVLDGIGLPGQLKLKNASVVIVGAGGLGCPAAQYLVATGVGTITVIDGDTVEISNLQRQILHSDVKIGMHKAQSINQAAGYINPNVKVVPVLESFNSTNAQSLLHSIQPDVVLDCTDNPSTRYLVSDSVVIHNRSNKRATLISAAATGFNGQIITLCYSDDAPCYRCIIPRPPPVQTVTSCADDGILGVVTGTLGTLQATECIKVLLGMHSGESAMTIYSALAPAPFRTMKMRGRKKNCFANGDDDEERLENVEDIDYLTFTGAGSCGVDMNLSKNNEISVEDFMASRKNNDLVLDTRSAVEYGICHIDGSINLPITDLLKDPSQVQVNKNDTAYVFCRRGNDSQIATDALLKKNQLNVKNVQGGLARYINEAIFSSNYTKAQSGAGLCISDDFRMCL